MNSSHSHIATFAKGEPQSEYIYTRLMEEIENRQLLPGDRLRETEIAARLNVSRTPVREALRLLETEGVVSHQPRQGTIIRKLSYAEIMELYDMRVVLEGAAARFAARSASDLELHHLQLLSEEFAQASDPHQSAKLNQRFHLALLHTAKNKFLTQSMNTLSKSLLLLGQTTLADEVRASGAIAEHTAIMEALLARDAIAAEQHMRTHIEAAQKSRICAALQDEAE